MTIRMVPRGAEPLRALGTLIGPSSSGKTYSALRVATGMAEVLQTRIAMIDTELRGNLYEGTFEFDRFVFDPPFTPKAWMDAFAELDGKYGVIISDNFSDEYEGPGGIAEMAANSTLSNDVAKWAKPKAEHKQLMNRIRLLKSQHLFLLRASEKIEVFEGEDALGRKKKLVRDVGWQPHGEKNLKYDITFGWMLPPDSKGHGLIYKTIEGLPFKDRDRLGEDHGRMIARWTLGEAAAGAPAQQTWTVVDQDGAVVATVGSKRDALAAYGEVKQQPGQDPRLVAIANLDLLRALLPHTGNGVRTRLGQEIEAAEAAA